MRQAIEVGDQFIFNGLPCVITYKHESKRRFTFSPIVSRQTPAMAGAFVDSAWINGDPVWPLFVANGQWETTRKPQTVTDYAYGDDYIAISGDEPYLYGTLFVHRRDMFPTQQGAVDECERRNAK